MSFATSYEVHGIIVACNFWRDGGDVGVVRVSDLAHVAVLPEAGRVASLRTLFDDSPDLVPPIVLAQLSRGIEVLDGHHRLTVARERQIEFLAAIWTLCFDEDGRIQRSTRV